MKLLAIFLVLSGIGPGQASLSSITPGQAQALRGFEPPPDITCVDDEYEVIQGHKLSIQEPGFLANDVVSMGSPVYSSARELGDFAGKLKIDKKKNGKFRYEPPNADFTGDEVFEYTACLDTNATICDTAQVTIHVLVDPHRPDQNPVAKDDYYDVKEGQTLYVNADDGFLSNDEVGTPSSPLQRCDRDGSPEGDLDTHKDGSFTYEAPKCWTGQDSFTYTACYEDYEEMESNTGRVHIQVERDPHRPDRPNPDDDHYEVWEADTLTVKADTYKGLLWNDEGQDLYIETWSKQSGFRGDLDVDEDGSFEFQSLSGRKGTFRFTYTVCEEEWDCVGCADATVEIKVVTNPNKPKSPPSPTNPTYQTNVGEVVTGNVLDEVEKDNRYSLQASNFRLGNGAQGVLNGQSDGSFEYGNAPAGSDTILFNVCYKEWPDLCSQGSITITTTGSTGSSSISRQGIATYFDVFWAGQSQKGCESIQTSVILTCSGNGAVNLISAGIPSDNASCQKAGNIIACAPKDTGSVQVECRDSTGNNSGNRQLIATLTSAAVSCGSTGGFDPSGVHHYGHLRTWCNATWVDWSIGCDQLSLGNPNGPDLCFSNAFTLGPSAKPADITMTSTTSADQCFVGAGSVVPLPEPPMLEIIGDADLEPANGYPLQECQADCDNDTECSGDLICFQRTKSEVVPGCVGSGSQFNGKDFCVRPGTPVSRVGSP